MKTRINRTVPFLTFSCPFSSQKAKNNRFAFTLVAVLLLLFVSLQGQWSQLYAADKTEAPQKNTQTKQDETNKNKYYTITDELVCGDVRVVVIFTPEDNEIENPWPQGEEKLFIKENKKTIGNNHWGKVSQWGCVTKNDDKNKKYIAINFVSGGNCMNCEWDEIYDLKGRLLMSNYLELQGTDEKYYYCAEQYLKYIAGFSASWFKEDCKKEMNEKRFKKIKNIVENKLAVSKKIEKLTGKHRKNLGCPKFLNCP